MCYHLKRVFIGLKFFQTLFRLHIPWLPYLVQAAVCVFLVSVGGISCCVHVGGEASPFTKENIT
jgi:hypothetical protein